MTGKLLINGVDIYTTYNAYMTQGGFEELIQYPSLKDVEINDWHEEDGIEVDLSDPKLDSREITISMGFSGGASLFFDFVKFITTGAVHTWNFTEIQRSYNLRLIANTDISNVGGLRVVKFSLADDSPLSGYSYQAPTSSYNVRSEDYELDSTPLSEYGVSILEGTLSEIEKIPSVKINLLRTNNKMNGSIYDGSLVRFSEKKANIKCLIRAENLTELWRNWDALLFNLSKPNQRTIYTPITEKEYPCYYNSCKVNNFAGSGRLWIDFELEMTFMAIIVEGSELVLESESGFIIMTEDGDLAIDMTGNEQYLD